MIPLIDEGKCTGCETCFAICPPQAIVMTGDVAVIEDEFCEECGFCAARCPVEAISIVFPLGPGH
jgi:Pyruvate/2-oxoacid:ferredoxin oxidoreductase delta subunit